MAKEMLRFETWAADGYWPAVRVGGSDSKDRAIELCKETQKVAAWAARSYTQAPAGWYYVIDTKTGLQVYNTKNDTILQNTLKAIY